MPGFRNDWHSQAIDIPGKVSGHRPLMLVPASPTETGLISIKSVSPGL
jgi:hypothetical protein